MTWSVPYFGPIRSCLFWPKTFISLLIHLRMFVPTMLFRISSLLIVFTPEISTSIYELTGIKGRHTNVTGVIWISMSNNFCEGILEVFRGLTES